MATTKKPVSTVCSKAGRTLATVCRTKKVAVKAAPKAAVKKTVAKPAPKAVGKVKLDRIIIHWAEGTQTLYDNFPKTYKSYAAANKAIIPVYNSFVKSGGEGYNKVKYTVYWKDGEDYQGRLDVSYKQDNPTKTTNVIGAAMKSYATYILSERSKSSEASKKEARDFVKTYEL
jgi:hypothetical protein